MKISLSVLLLALPMAVLAQKKFTITGRLKNTEPPSKIYLSYRIDGKTTTDSATVKAGAFSFRGQVKGIIPAILFEGYTTHGPGNMYGHAKVHPADIYLEAGNIKVTGNALPDVQITGTPVNQTNIGYKAFIKPVTERSTTLYAEYADAKPGTRRFQEYEQKKAIIDNEELELNKAYVRLHPNSYISLLLLGKIGGHYPKYDEMAPMFNSLSKTVKNTPLGKDYAAMLFRLQELTVNSTAPEIMQPDTNGRMISLSSFKGKYVLIDFWASWCGPCRKESPNVLKVFQKYNSKNFTVLGVSLDGPKQKQAWINAIKTDGLTWPQVSDLKFWNNAAAARYYVHAIPQNYLIDPDGKIIAKNLRGEELENKLAEIFGKI